MMSSSVSKLLAAVTAMAAVVAAPAAAAACDFDVGYTAMQISDEEPEADAEFPDPVALEADSPGRADRTGTVDSCQPYGTLNIEVAGYDPAYTDEDTGESQYGLRFDIEGTHPDGFRVSNNPVALLYDADRALVIWNDDETSTDAIDATITATWVDEYGREGPTSDPLHVTHDGAGAFGGCTTTGAATTPAAVIVVLALLALATPLTRRPQHT